MNNNMYGSSNSSMYPSSRYGSGYGGKEQHLTKTLLSFKFRIFFFFCLLYMCIGYGMNSYGGGYGGMGMNGYGMNGKKSQNTYICALFVMLFIFMYMFVCCLLSGMMGPGKH